MQLFTSPIFFLLLLSAVATAHNITNILAKHPEFSTFNHYLSLTHLAGDINAHTTITVCAVDNAAMNTLLAKHPSITTIKHVLSFHVLLDYFGSKKLHQITDGSALAATMFQATGTATGSSGFVNITDVKGGKVSFGPKENAGELDVLYVKSLEEIPYNISVIHVTNLMPSLEAEAPSLEAEAPAPEPSATNLTDIMSAHGCKVFADTLSANPEASKTYQGNVDGGLTVFCPMDDPFKSFLPKFKNLTAAGKVSLLEYFGVPVYQSLSTLKSNNGPMNTLATDGAKKFDFTVQNDGEKVTLKTRAVTAKIVGTLIDEQPLAIYSIDKVLLPKELFKEALPPAPAPAPEKPADAPKPAGKKKKPSKKPADTPADAPSDDDGGDVADQQADDGVRLSGGSVVVMLLSLWLGLWMM